MSGKPAARVSDPTACPLPGHGSNPIVVGSADVFFDGLAAARQGDASAWRASMPGSSMRSSEMGESGRLRKDNGHRGFPIFRPEMSLRFWRQRSDDCHQ